MDKVGNGAIPAEWTQDWRKPNPGMLNQAIMDAQVYSNDVLFIGDRDTDEKAAQAAGCDFIYIQSIIDDYLIECMTSTVYFVCWKEEGKGGYYSGFGHGDKDKAIQALNEFAAQLENRNPEYPPITWMGLRSETVINEYHSLAEIKRAKQS